MRTKFSKPSNLHNILGLAEFWGRVNSGPHTFCMLVGSIPKEIQDNGTSFYFDSHSTMS